MKKLSILLVCLMFTFGAIAQTATPAPAQTAPAKKEVKSTPAKKADKPATKVATVKSDSTSKLKKDGTPDKRFKANKPATKVAPVKKDSVKTTPKAKPVTAPKAEAKAPEKKDAVKTTEVKAPEVKK